uniref:VP5 n=1 Tax=Halorubrum pleomorphic virus 2 TaxID=1156719 RepID=UPI00102D67DD|nr:Chain A, VP5 [Halorubrum pleomorphic virus 2]
IAPLVGVGLAAGAVGVGWALREFEIVGSDAPPEGLTADALKQQVYQTAKTRKSTNASTIVDNQNILDGVKHTAYTDAKIAAIEELNAGSAESAVLDAATTEVNSYLTTVQSNFLKTWNESVAELDSILSTVVNHPDIGKGDVFLMLNGSDNTIEDLLANPSGSTDATSFTLADGTTMSVGTVEVDRGTESYYYDPMSGLVGDLGDLKNGGPTVQYDGDSLVYLNASNWKPIYDEMDTVLQNVRSGISTWVSNVYGDVQSGEIEVSDLVTPRERAAMMAQEEGMSQAIADLIALNVPVDAEREATITIQDTGATLPGTFALTDASDGPLESGKTYDPSTFSGDVYFTADMSLVEGDWTAYQSGVDGGNVTLTSEPYSGTAVELNTAANETVAVDAGNWTATGNGTWYHDVSPELETDITSIESARFLSTAEQTQYETIQLQGSFTIDKLTNTQTGEEVTATSFDSSEPHTDSNYITQEEWDQLEQQNKELIEKYEQSQSGGGLDLGQFDMFGIPGEIVAVGVAALVGLGVLGNN